jgi:hypothetical protein
MRLMTIKITTTLAALWLAMPFALSSAGAAPAQDGGDCVSARQAQPLVEQGLVLSVDEAMRREGVETTPSSVRLCDADGSPYWLVNVMDAQADAKRIVLNAQTN